MVCYYCADAMSPHNINQNCEINKRAKNIPSDFEGFTKEKPDDKHIGTGWHYFSVPVDNLFENGQAFNNMQKLFSDEQSEVLKKGVLLQIEKYLASVKRKLRELNINLASVFKGHDKE